jgi:AcrR family transcriptional regulator
MKKRTARSAPAPARSDARSARTREHILDASLVLLRRHGFEGTTMRDVAAAAGMSLGAAYYHFASKEAIVLSYYERVAAELERRAERVFESTSDLRARIVAVLVTHLDLIRRDRKLLGGLIRSVGDPTSTVSVFARDTAGLRARSIALYERALAVEGIPSDLQKDGALGLWTLQLAIVLYFIHDASPRQERTRRLAEEAIDLLLPLAPLLALPEAAVLRAHVRDVLAHAGLLQPS